MTLFSDLLPLMLGSVLAPIWIIIVLLILKSPNGLVKAIAFVAGVTLTRLLQGFIFGYVIGNAATTKGDANHPSMAMSLLLLVLGLLLLIAAVKTLMNEDDPDAPPPRWMSRLDRAEVPAMFGLGALFTLLAAKLWVFTLSAIGVIRGAGLASPADELMWFLIYILGAQSLIILPLILCAIAPRQSVGLLNAAADWLAKHNRLITLVVSVVFGVLFLWKGFSNLLT